MKARINTFALQQNCLQSSALGVLGSIARPQSLASDLSQPFVHALDEEAYSRYEPGVVTCTSCHSPHRGMPAMGITRVERGVPKRSPRNPAAQSDG